MHGINGMQRAEVNVWHFPKPRRTHHPTAKPVPLMAYPIGNSTRQRHCLRSVSGSGATLIAANKPVVSVMDTGY